MNIIPQAEQIESHAEQIESHAEPHPVSKQQSNIIQAIIEEKNIMVNAVFGSGKTTTILNTMQRLPDKKAVLITYNTHLKNEVLEKVNHFGLTNISVFTYHSLCMKYFGYGKNDEELQIYEKTPPIHPIEKIDILFIDEIQDMTFILYSFVQKFLHYSQTIPQIIICGDHLQGVYQFKGADKRFLTLGQTLFHSNPSKPFEFFEMSTSYRLTNPMGWFINQCIYGKKILDTVKPGPPIVFFNTSPYQAVYGIVKCLTQYIKEGAKPEDIFILVPSLRCAPKSPLKVLENLICEKLNLPVYYSTNEDRELNDKVIQNKVVFSTFHQSKGRERKVVVVFGLDESYFDFYAKDETRLECPSTLIVALSRAKERLLIVKDIQRKPVPFMKKSIIQLSKFPENIHIIGKVCDYEITSKNYQPNDDFRKTTVSDLVKYIKPEIQSLITEYKNQLFVKKTEILDNVELKTIVECGENGLSEDVSDLIGMLIPCVFEEMQCGTSSIKQSLNQMRDQALSDFLWDKLERVNMDCNIETPRDLLYMVQVYKSINNGIYSPFQLERDDWLTKDEIQRVVKNIEYHISENQIYECDFQESERPIFYNHPEFGKIHVTGRMDCLDKQYVWEFKCVRELSLEHFLQVICYQWLWNLCLKEKYGERVFRLLNIRTGEMYELEKNEVLITDIILLLFMSRYEKSISISDDEFIKICSELKNNYLVPTE